MNLPVLATWLRGIGRFAERAGAKRSEGAGAPAFAWHTDYFIRHELPLPSDLEASRCQLADLASQTGNGVSREGEAILKAGRLAAGQDPDAPASPAQTRLADARLPSIFARLRLNGRGVPAGEPPLFYQLRPLGGPVFPKPLAEKGADYKTYWAEFTAEIAKLPCEAGAAQWQASLVSLLERYCWCIPLGAEGPLAEISLYDHAAISAALAQAMLASGAGRGFMLFGGDLSGIQTFIFGREEPADKGAVRLLRARSFLLQAVTRSVWLALINRLGLDPCAKVMDAGGRFALLLPDTDAAGRELDRLETDAQKWLFARFMGAVRLNFGRMALSEGDLVNGDLATAFDGFNESLEKAKLQPFRRIKAELPILPVKYADYREFGECGFCHDRPGVALEEDEPVCAECASLKRIGRILPHARFIAFARDIKPGKRSFSEILFDGIGLRFYAERPEGADAKTALQILSIRDEPVFTVAPIAGHIPVVTRADLDKWLADGRATQKDGRNFFMGQEFAPDEPMTFAMLAEAARIPPEEPGGAWTCLPCLGVCKADVDNLGLIFSLGFGANFSLARYAMLARMLNHFFSGYLMRLIRAEFPEIYVVFAGGDDVFVIGPWTSAIRFGLRMASDFRKFAGGNPAVTISAGIPLIKPRLPMRAMREEAENWLEKSKECPNKNSVTIFNVPAHWHEAEKLLADGRWLADLCETGRISRGFLRRLLEYAKECRKFSAGKGLAKNGLYLSHLAYDLARNWRPGPRQDREAGREDADLNRIKSLAQDKDLFPKSEMGISWAIYRTRIS